ncbi:MAG: TIGR03936 family radical SAM-associated protein [Coriobacteriaceae bacterium]|nr:TIGR03936 family radical SAM-associated protein [Coriobacteriaceae bacterium]
MAEGFLLRIRYVKRGRLVFLSHLETVRSMERCIRRARLPYAISEGFNPHMKVAFGPALPVGIGSEMELLDLRLREYLNPDEAMRRLQEAGTDDLQVTDCAYISLDASSVTVAYPLFDWEALLADADAGTVRAAFDALLERGYIEVIRKKQMRRVDFDGRLVGDLQIEQEGSDVALRFTTRNQASGALRPDRFIAAAFADCADAPSLRSCTRLAMREES